MHIKTIYKTHSGVTFSSYWPVRDTSVTYDTCMCLLCQLHSGRSVQSPVIFRLAGIQGQVCWWPTGETTSQEKSLWGATCLFFYLAPSVLAVVDGNVGHECVWCSALKDCEIGDSWPSKVSAFVGCLSLFLIALSSSCHVEYNKYQNVINRLSCGSLTGLECRGLHSTVSPPTPPQPRVSLHGPGQSSWDTKEEALPSFCSIQSAMHVLVCTHVHVHQCCQCLQCREVSVVVRAVGRVYLVLGGVQSIHPQTSGLTILRKNI